MRVTLALVLIGGLIASPIHALAQGQAGPSAPGPIGRSVAREAVRLAAETPSTAQAAPPAQADSAEAPVALRWNELGPLVVGQKVEVTLADGRVVRGEALAVRETELVIDAKSEPNGSTAIPRASVAGMTVIKTTGSGGRVLGTTLGILGGMMICGYTAATLTDSGAVGWPVVIGGTTAFGMLGHYLGKKLDTHTTRITIIP